MAGPVVSQEPDLGLPADAAALRRNHWVNQVARHGLQIPDRPALRWQGTTVTWGELAQRVRAMADALHRRGLRPGDRLAVLMLNRPEFLVVTFAANRIGALVVPVNFRLTPNEIAYVLRDSGAAGVVLDEPFLPVLATSGAAPDLVVVTASSGPPGSYPTYEQLVDEPGAAHPPIDVPEDAPALIMYTSGTTGRPKGAVLTHVNLQAQALTSIRAFGLVGDDEVFLLGTPLFHIGGIGSVIALVLTGGTVVVQPTGLFDPVATLDLLEGEGVTGTFLVPAQWQLLCDAADGRDLPSLRTMSWGAAPATDALLHLMAATFPRATTVAVFGQTEMSPVTCVLEAKDSLRKLGSVGKAIPTLAFRVVDEDMRDVEPGTVGEIVYRGPTQMLGYWNKPVETAEAFAGGWFHSGDLVRVDDEGFVYVVDRKKDMIITGGENVYCAEVENVLSDHPAIAEVSVIGRVDSRWGETPVAVVVPHDPGRPVDLAEVRGWATARLARYKLPSALVTVESLPRNASGKVLKGVLRQQFSGRS